MGSEGVGRRRVTRDCKLGDVEQANLQAMRRNVNVVEKSQRESDTLRGAAGDFAPANFADKRAKYDCVEEDLREVEAGEREVGGGGGGVGGLQTSQRAQPSPACTIASPMRTTAEDSDDNVSTSRLATLKVRVGGEGGAGRPQWQRRSRSR
jgi:hypothetical protein